MWKENSGFTALQNPCIDLQIAKQMKIISNEILKTFRKVDSIILAGGFGRGEGTVRISPGGKVLPVNDYDIFVITNQKVSEKEYLDLIERIHNKLRLKSTTRFSVAPGEFSISIEIMPKNKLGRLLPDISTIDLKMASKVIYGDDLRGEIPFGPEDIVLSSGVLILINKVIGLLEHMDPSLLSKTPNNVRAKLIIYQCARAFMEMCSALLIMSKLYVPLYSEKAERFIHIYPQEFPDLYQRFPDLASKVQLFTEQKLKSKFDEYKVKPVALWFTTKKYLMGVLRFYIQTFLGIDQLIDDWVKLSEEMYRKMGFKFFREYLHYNLRKRIWYRPSLLPLLLFLGQIYDNVRFIRRIWLLKKKLYLAPILFWRSPLIKIFSASVLSLDAIHEDGSVDSASLEKSYSFIKQAYPCDESYSTDIMKWNKVRKVCIEAMKVYYQKEKVTI